MAAPLFDNIPQELRNRRQWLLWKQLTRAGKPTKVPYQTNGIEADSSSPHTWTKYDAVVEAYHKGGYDGIGYVFDPIDPYAGVDLDDCINADGIIKSNAKAILDKLNSYSEISPSGKGIKIFVKATNPVNIEKKDGKFQQGFKSEKPDLEIEVYYGNRFFTLTGNRLTDYSTAIEDRDRALTTIFKEVFKDRNYFDGDQVPGPHREHDAKVEPLSHEAAERLQELFDADPAFKNELFTPAPTGKRSTIECYLCSRLWEAAFDRLEIWSIMDSSPQTKWQERDRSYRWSTIEAGIAKAEATQREKKEGLNEAGTSQEVTAKEPTVKGMSQDEFEKFKLPTGPKFSINLPADHFITRFMGYGAAISDAYLVYWFMAALFILGVVADKKLMFKTRMATFYLNVWIYILGDSSLARKTTAVQKAYAMLEAVLGLKFANACIPNTFSHEAFIEHMSNYPHAPWVRDEAAGVLSIMQKDYMRGFKDDLMQLFDCTKITRMLRTKKSGEKSRFNVDDPYLNLFFASTGAALGYNLDLIDKETGFLARFAFAYPQDEKENYMPLDKGAAIHSELEEICISQLSTIAAQIDAIPSCIDMTHSPNARSYYNAWQETRDKEAAALKDGYSSQIFSRLNPFVMKMAMAFEVGSIDFDPTRPIREEYFREACRLVDTYFMPTTRAVYDLIGTANKDNQIEKIVLYLSRHGGKATRKEIMRDVKIKSREITEYLLTMEECEMIETKNVYNEVTRRNTAYVFLKDQRVANVGKVVEVGKVEKVEDKIIEKETVKEKITVPTSSTFSTLATSPTFHEDKTVSEDVDGDGCSMGPHPRRAEPTPATKKRPQEPDKVRILAVDGYRTQIPLPDNPSKFVDHLYSFGEIIEVQHWKACDLVKRGIAEAVKA